jgi:hypothetical protein
MVTHIALPPMWTGEGASETSGENVAVGSGVSAYAAHLNCHWADCSEEGIIAGEVDIA